MPVLTTPNQQTHKRKHNDYMREITHLRVVTQENLPAGASPLVVEGKAIVYNEPTKIFRFANTDYYEVIDRGAFANADLSNAFFKYNHSDEQLVLARFKNGTLTFDDREDGVYIRAELADTTLGRDLYTLIQRGDIDKMSFAFTVKKENQETSKDTNTGIDTVTFRVMQIDKLYDVAAVWLPAYENTSIYTRRQQEVEADVARVEALLREKNKKKLQVKIRCKL